MNLHTEEGGGIYFDSKHQRGTVLFSYLLNIFTMIGIYNNTLYCFVCSHLGFIYAFLDPHHIYLYSQFMTVS